MILFCVFLNSSKISERLAKLDIKNSIMPYPFSQFCADIKFDIRSDNIFDIKLGDSLHVNHTINFVIKLRSYGTV